MLKILQGLNFIPKKLYSSLRKKKAVVKHIILNLGLNTLNNASRKHCAIVSVLCLKELGQTATRQAAEFPMAFKGDFSIGPCPDYKETLYSNSVTQDALSVPLY